MSRRRAGESIEDLARRGHRLVASCDASAAQTYRPTRLRLYAPLTTPQELRRRSARPHVPVKDARGKQAPVRPSPSTTATRTTDVYAVLARPIGVALVHPHAESGRRTPTRGLVQIGRHVFVCRLDCASSACGGERHPSGTSGTRLLPQSMQIRIGPAGDKTILHAWAATRSHSPLRISAC